MSKESLAESLVKLAAQISDVKQDLSVQKAQQWYWYETPRAHYIEERQETLKELEKLYAILIKDYEGKQDA